jgi:hypothetical protein
MGAASLRPYDRKTNVLAEKESALRGARAKVFCFAAPTRCQIRGPIVPSIRHIALDHHRDPASKQKTVGPLTDKPSNELD